MLSVHGKWSLETTDQDYTTCLGSPLTTIDTEKLLRSNIIYFFIGFCVNSGKRNTDLLHAGIIMLAWIKFLVYEPEFFFMISGNELVCLCKQSTAMCCLSYNIYPMTYNMLCKSTLTLTCTEKNNTLILCTD